MTAMKEEYQIPIRPLVIIGATGTFGKAFARLCKVRGIPYKLLSRQEMDITNVHAVMTVLQEIKPWALVNATGYVRVDEAEENFEECNRINALGPAILAAACRHLSIQLLTYSSDLIFDGGQSHPYAESDQPAPLPVYGRTKALGEARVLSLYPSALGHSH